MCYIRNVYWLSGLVRSLRTVAVRPVVHFPTLSSFFSLICFFFLFLFTWFSFSFCHRLNCKLVLQFNTEKWWTDSMDIHYSKYQRQLPIKLDKTLALRFNNLKESEEFGINRRLRSVDQFLEDNRYLQQWKEKLRSNNATRCWFDFRYCTITST